MKERIAFAETVTDASSDAPPPVRSGAVPVIAGLDRYRLVGRLGAGGMGVVYEAVDQLLERRVALKLVAPSRHSERDPRWQIEARAMAKLSHPNVTTVYDVGFADDTMFIAMELVDGGTLRDRVGKRAPWRDEVALLVSAGRGLAAAHAVGVIHRDFKPENVLLAKDGCPKVADFGLARGLAAAEPSPTEPAPTSAAHTDTIAGTLAYMAPESILGELSAAADQFAFCVTAYELLEGTRPFDVAGPDAFSAQVLAGARRAWQREDVPLRVRALVDRGLAGDPAARWPVLDHLLDALAAASGRSRRLWLAAPVAVVGIGTLAYLALGTAPASRSVCDGEAEAIVDVWNPLTRTTYVARGGPFLDEDLQWFDRHAERWQSAARTVCQRRRTSAAIAGSERCIVDARASLVAALVRRDRSTWPDLADPRDCLTSRPTLHPLRASSQAVSGAFSPDGSRVALATTTQSLTLVDSAHGATVASLAIAFDEIHHFNGNTLIATRPDGTLVRHSLDSGELSVLSAQRVLGSSADASTLVRESGPDLVFERASDGLELTRLTSDGAQPWCVDWERGGRRVLVTSVERAPPHVVRLHIVDLPTRRAVPVPLRFQAPGGTCARWAGRDRVVIHGNVSTTSDAVWRLQLDGNAIGDLTRLTPQGSPQYAVMNADQQRILIVEYTRGIEIARIRGGVAAPLRDTQEERLASADARRGWLLAARQAAARVITIDGTTIRTVGLKGETQGLALRDGLILVTRTRDGGSPELIEIEADGRERHIASFAGAQQARVTCSAWGSSCAVGTISGNGARVASLDGDKIGRWWSWPWPAQDFPPWLDDVTLDGRVVGASWPDVVTFDLRSGTHDRFDSGKPHSTSWSRDGNGMYIAAYGDLSSYALRARQVRSGVERETARVAAMMLHIVAIGEDDVVATTSNFETKLGILDLEAP